VTTKQQISLLEQTWSSCKYRKEYPQMLLDHLSKGLSYSSFDVPGGVSYSTLREWERRFPAFAQAREIGEKKKLKLLEEIGLKLCRDGNASVWKFFMHQHGLSEAPLEVNHNHSTGQSTSPHMAVPPEIRHYRLQKIKELHQIATKRMEREKDAREKLKVELTRDETVIEAEEIAGDEDEFAGL
jgi:hypothetical protein